LYDSLSYFIAMAIYWNCTPWRYLHVAYCILNDPHDDDDDDDDDNDDDGDDYDLE